jgi:mxaL protein
VDGRPSLIFITDGHEAPPLNPHLRLTFDGKPGDVGGVILGVGGDTLVPIPKRDREGTFLGYWAADEVPQTDLYSRGRPTSVAGESMVDENGQPERPMAATGTEHLSSLKEAHLRELATETGLSYQRLQTADALEEELTQPALARTQSLATPVRAVPAVIALLLLLVLVSPPLRRPARVTALTRTAVPRTASQGTPSASQSDAA